MAAVSLPAPPLSCAAVEVSHGLVDQPPTTVGRTAAHQPESAEESCIELPRTVVTDTAGRRTVSGSCYGHSSSAGSELTYLSKVSQKRRKTAPAAVLKPSSVHLPLRQHLDTSFSQAEVSEDQDSKHWSGKTEQTPEGDSSSVSTHSSTMSSEAEESPCEKACTFADDGLTALPETRAESHDFVPDSEEPVCRGFHLLDVDLSDAAPPDKAVPAARTSFGSLSSLTINAQWSGLTAARQSATDFVDKVIPANVGDVPFFSFTAFLVALFLFTFVTNVLLAVTDVRARSHSVGFTALVPILNYAWVVFEAFLFGDILWSYFRYFKPGSTDEERAKFLGSNFNQPRCWALLTRILRLELAPRGYLMLLALILPVNALLFYPSIGSPFYTPSRLQNDALDQLLQEISPRGTDFAGLHGWEINASGTEPLNPPLKITNTQCYHYQSPEFRILSTLVHEALPKQAYCESLLGTMLANWRQERSNAEWQHDEDIWEECFQFVIRLFGSLAGIVADQTQDEVSSWFLRDMTDVFDMYMMAFVDVDQMHEGRPLLNGNHGIFGTEVMSTSYHVWVGMGIWFGYATVCLRALSMVGWMPVVSLIRFCGSKAELKELRDAVDASLALIFIEIPFLCLRWTAWHRYGVPVSVMGVKNVFGIFEDLHALGLIRGFKTVDSSATQTPRGFQVCLCCKRFERRKDSE